MLLTAQNEAGDRSLEAKLLQPVPPRTDAGSRKILDYHVRALGGELALRNVKSIRAKSLTREGKNNDEHAELIVVYPDKFHLRRESKFKGKPSVTTSGSNGEAEWRHEETRERAVPEPVSGKSPLPLWITPHLDWEDRNLTYEYLGEAKSRGRKHYLLKQYQPDGQVRYFYFDAKTLLVTREGWEEIVSGTIVDKDVYYTHYEKVDGIWMPTQVEFAMEGQVYGNREYTLIEFNPAYDPAIFDMPETNEIWLRSQ